MGGALTLDSAPAGGSRFTLSLPFRRCAPEAAPTPVEAPSTDPARSLRVLVADDNAVNRMVMQGLLEAEGHAVALAENGAEALAAIRAAPEGFDVVLMDHQMPVMDGAEATRRIRALGVGPEALPILALTANAFEAQRRHLIDAGMQDVLTKPFRMEDLAAALGRCGGRRRAA
jgi:CheY-like chemotaxis protein